MIDPLCKRYGIRMIVLDRPGIGATPVVPLEKRIEVSCRKSCTSFHALHPGDADGHRGEKLKYSTCCFGVGTSKSQTSPSTSGISGDLVCPAPRPELMEVMLSIS